MSIPATARWPKLGKITTLFLILGPTVFAAILTLEIVVFSLFWVHYPWPLLLRTLQQSVIVTLAFGAPYALITGGLFAISAVFFGWGRIWVALAIALILITVVSTMPQIGFPVWRLPAILTAAVGLPLIVAVALCWLISRRWFAW